MIGGVCLAARLSCELAIPTLCLSPFFSGRFLYYLENEAHQDQKMDKRRSLQQIDKNLQRLNFSGIDVGQAMKTWYESDKLCDNNLESVVAPACPHRSIEFRGRAEDAQDQDILSSFFIKDQYLVQNYKVHPIAGTVQAIGKPGYWRFMPNNQKISPEIVQESELTKLGTNEGAPKFSESFPDATLPKNIVGSPFGQSRVQPCQIEIDQDEGKRPGAARVAELDPKRFFQHTPLSFPTERPFFTKLYVAFLVASPFAARTVCAAALR